jgi:hypothetical protein
MNPLLLEKLNAHPELLPDQADQQYTITGVSWQAYEALLSDLGDDFPGLRIHYLDGTLEITMPGRQQIYPSSQLMSCIPNRSMQ